ncbi:MAG TPA: DUF3857 domain-containing protein [Verrucomicrobiae bacterium]|jgi:transglutaminase-like putative cysteine protease|nr:DUF3857 domain-containing protein [Verrucomicrobiae bacterium]
MDIRRFIIAVWMLAGGARLLAQDSILFGPPAAWVTPLSLERNAAQADAAPGESARWLIKDRQINARLNQTYGHEVRQILTSGGVQNFSQISIAFDPTCESLTFHWIKIHRGNEVLDRYERAKIHVIQRESELEDFLFNGLQTAVLALDDVRRGDIIDYAYTITGNNPAFLGHSFGQVAVQMDEPVARLRARVIWPMERPLYLKNYLTSVRPITTRHPDSLEVVWDFKNVPALQVEDSTPIWFRPYPAVELSEFHQWSEVNQWALSLFTNSTPLSPELISQINVWRKLRDPAAQTLAALQFVQDEIRYLGVETGPNAYTPTAPATVFQRRYGDCKDKAFLLVNILRALGIPAFPALVNTDDRQTIADRQPATTLFDHVIAEVMVSGQAYWLDATATYQRGPLAERYHPDYGFALVVRPGAVALTPIPPSGGQPKTTVTDYFQMGRPPDSSALKVVTVAEGADAVRLRRKYATNPREQIEADELNYLAKLYPQITRTAPSVFTDDESGNRVEVDEFYNINGDWSRPPPDNVWWTFHISSHNVDAAMRLPGGAARTMPLGVAYPSHQFYRAEVRIPVAQDIAADDQTIRHRAFYFHRSVNVANQVVYLAYEYHALSDVVPPVEVADYSRQLEQASGLLDFTIASYPPLQ